MHVERCYLCGTVNWDDLAEQIRGARAKPTVGMRIAATLVLTALLVIGLGALATIAGWVWHAARLAWM